MTEATRRKMKDYIPPDDTKLSDTQSWFTFKTKNSNPIRQQESDVRSSFSKGMDSRAQGLGKVP